jgi:hypothetical protein
MDSFVEGDESGGGTKRGEIMTGLHSLYMHA